MGILPRFEPEPKPHLLRKGLVFQPFELNTTFPKFHPPPIFRFFYFPIFRKKYNEGIKSNFIPIIYTTSSIGTLNITNGPCVVFLELNRKLVKFWGLVPFFAFFGSCHKN